MRTHKTRLLVWLAIILLLGFAITSVANYMVSRNSIRESILAQELPLTGDNIYSELQKDLLRPVFISSLMARDTFLRDWVIAGEQNPAQLARYLKEIKEQYGTISSFFISERTHAYYYPDGQLKEVSANDPRDKWYFRVRQMTDPYEINVDLDMANRNTMTVFINHRVMDYHGKFIGAAGVGLTLEKVVRLVDSYQQRFDRRIFFVSPTGELMLKGSKEPLMQERNIRQMPGLQLLAEQILVERKTPISLKFTLDGSSTHVNSRFIPELGWFLVVEQNEEKSLQTLRKMALINFCISVVVTLLALGVTWYVVQNYQRRLELMATTDKLTGLLNRQALDMLLDQSIKDAQREKFALSTLILDIDHFKNINDRHGHVMGDRVIVAVAERIKRQLRNNDIIVRWGGEEFLVLLRNCPLTEAGRIAEQIRAAIAEMEITVASETPLRVTVSLGVTEYVPGESADTTFARADAALYRAKSAGRNRTEIN